jgi:hypothetical protein
MILLLNYINRAMVNLYIFLKVTNKYKYILYSLSDIPYDIYSEGFLTTNWAIYGLL